MPVAIVAASVAHKSRRAATPRGVTWLAALLALLCCSTFGQASDADLARWLVEQSWRAENPRGIAVLPEGGPLALELARASQFLVVAQEADHQAVQQTALAAEAAGLLGTRVVVAQAGATSAVTAARAANVLALVRVTDSVLTRLDGAALLNQVAPDGGRLVVGKAASTPGSLDRGALEAWAKKLGSVEMRQDAQGLFAVITRGPVSLSAPWTHRFYDASGNSVSTDRAFTWPAMTQWMGKPYLDGGGMILVSDGVYIAVTEGIPSITAQRIYDRDGNAIVARDVNNGQVLWIKAMDPTFQYAGLTSPMAIHDGVLFVIAPKSKSVLRFDLHTGKDMGSWDASALAGDALKWLAIADGRLYAMAGTADVRNLPGATWKMMVSPFGALSVSGAPDASTRPMGPHHISLGRGFAALDVKTGKTLWTAAEDQDCVYEYQIGVGNGAVYYHALDRGGVCLDGATGKERWRNPALVEAIKAQEADKATPMGLGHVGTVLVTTQAVVFYPVRIGPVTLDPADGRVLYRLPTKMHNHPLAFGDTLYLKGKGAFDLRTGSKKGADSDTKMSGGGCGVWSMTPELVCGQVGLTWLFGSRTDVSLNANHKSQCGSGSFVASGLYFQSGYQCTCPHSERGNVAQASAGDLTAVITAPLVEAERLTTAQGGKAGPAAIAGDWTHYRGAVAHGDASTAQTPATVAVRWTWKHPAPYTNPPRRSAYSLPEWESPQPLAVGDVIYAASADGAVRCFGLADGALRWVVHTGSRILVTPAYADGRLYVGGGDGVLRCLDAGDGDQRWSFRLAHTERRVMAWGHLLSTWPVSSDLLVQDGVVFAAASLQYINGTVVVALDAQSGCIRWQNTTSGKIDPSGLGVETVGAMTIAQGKLWVRGNAFTLTDGSVKVDPKYQFRFGKLNDVQSRVTGLMGDHLIWGGRRFWSEQNPHLREDMANASFIAALDGQGWLKPETGKQTLWKRPWNRISLPWGTMWGMPLMPSWDKDLVVITGRFPASGKPPEYSDFTARTLIALDRAGFLAACDDTSKPVLTSSKKSKDSPFRSCLADRLPSERWRVDGPAGSRWLAMVVTADAVLAINDPIDDEARMARRIKGYSYKVEEQLLPLHPLPTDQPCQLIAFNRADGSERWRVSLPSEPVMDGLAVARDGSVVVQLLDGGVVGVGAR